MRKLSFGLLCWVVLVLVHFDSFAQLNRKTIKKNNKRIASFKGRKQGFTKEKKYTSVGFSVNALNYYGDLSPLPSKFSTDISFTKPAVGISLNHRFGPRYTLQAQFMYGTLSGSDAQSAKAGDLNNGVFRHDRNLSFRNRIKELTVVAVFDLFENDATYISRVKWTPYVFAGGAIFLHNPQAIAPATYLDGTPDPYAGKWVDLRPLGTEGQYSTLQPTDANYGIKPYSLLQFAIPFGVGARFRLNEVMDLSADIGFRYTFTDYLDDVSKNYVDLGVLKSPLAQAMAYRTGEINPDPAKMTSYVGRDGKTYNVQAGYGQEGFSNWRGNKGSRDIYMVTSIKISYILGATFHKAKFR